MMPPGYWDKSTLLPAMQLVREKEREKQKRREELEAKKGRIDFICDRKFNFQMTGISAFVQVIGI